MVILVYYNLGLIFVVLAFVSINKFDIVLSKLMTDNSQTQEVRNQRDPLRPRCSCHCRRKCFINN